MKKIVLRTFFIVLLMLPVIAFAHYFAFPQESRCILIDFSGFKKEGQLYYTPGTPAGKIDSLKSIIRQASDRIVAFYGQKTCNPTFIYCNTDEEFAKYGTPYSDPATTHFKLGNYIVISNEGIDPDIIAHELGHAEFNTRVGFYAITFKVPVWFNEGLAMQNDNRRYYSEDTLKARSDNYRKMPGIEKINTPALFYGGTAEQVMLNFMAAKHEVRQWYTPQKLATLIQDMHTNRSFEAAYKKSY